jgi:hypothetical protein
MGVDISGINPIHRTPKPQYPNWNDIDEEEKDMFFKHLDKWESENPGDYFRSNWWGWRPIVMLVDFANDDYELGIDMDDWGSNDGAGLDNQEDCNRLADVLEEMIKTETELEDDVDTLYLNLGSWANMSGRFVDGEIEEKLNEEYPIGNVLYQSVVMEDGTIVHPAHSAPLRHINKFISFLRECGGFEIW